MGFGDKIGVSNSTAVDAEAPDAVAPAQAYCIFACFGVGDKFRKRVGQACAAAASINASTAETAVGIAVPHIANSIPVFRN
jgi:hypothetical protein